MKKTIIRALITSFVITIMAALINLISFFVTGEFLLAQTLNGGECVEWRGCGLLLRKIFPLDPLGSSNEVRTNIEFDLPSFLVTFAAGFILGFILFFIVYLAGRNKNEE